LTNNKLSYDKIIQCRIINEITGDEEMSRAFILTKLVNELGYPADRIEIEREYTAGRPHTITSRIDIIVRDSKGDAFLFIEVKSPDEYASIDKDKTIEKSHRLSAVNVLFKKPSISFFNESLDLTMTNLKR
jgi:type I restriction enzyme M protein